MIRPDGTVRRSRPGSFGGITNAHHIKLGGPWDSTFEPIFNQADSEMTDVVEWMSSLEASHADPNGPIMPRILAQPLPELQQHKLARTVASLMARSPRTRFVIRLTTEYYRSRFGMADPRAEDHLIAANQHGLYDAYQNRMGWGRWAILFTDSTEFIAGDGFLHNFPASRDGLNSGLKCVLPITPTATVVYMSPMSYPSEPKLVTLRLDDQEVRFFNETIQIYARDFLFFRSQQPSLIPAFQESSHQEYRYHANEWLEGLLDDLSQYNLWGPGGTPSRSRSYYLENFRMNAQLESLTESRHRRLE